MGRGYFWNCHGPYHYHSKCRLELPTMGKKTDALIPQYYCSLAPYIPLCKPNAQSLRHIASVLPPVTEHCRHSQHEVPHSVPHIQTLRPNCRPLSRPRCYVLLLSGSLQYIQSIEFMSTWLCSLLLNCRAYVVRINFLYICLACRR